jgi:hypothetical protein
MTTNLAGRVRHVVHLCFCDGVPRRSLGVAFIVGTILNLINQGDALLAFHGLSPTKAALTYLVPYCVATYGAVSYRLAAQRPQPTPPATDEHGSLV